MPYPIRPGLPILERERKRLAIYKKRYAYYAKTKRNNGEAFRYARMICNCEERIKALCRQGQTQ